MKNLKISRQLLLLVASFTLCFATAMYFELRKSADAIYAERYGMIRSQVESAVGIFNRFHAREQAGELTREEAQRQAFAAVSAMSFAGNNFVFAYGHIAPFCSCCRNMRAHHGAVEHLNQIGRRAETGKVLEENLKYA
jgi:methyl-accepting chemotaxis protein